MASIDAIHLLQQMRRRIEEGRHRPSLEYAEVIGLKDELREVAATIFGDHSPEIEMARVAILNPDQLRALEISPALPRIVRTGDEVPQIIPMPRASQTESYRKRLVEMDEIVASFILALATGNP